jgi:hypothetical protein
MKGRLGSQRMQGLALEGLKAVLSTHQITRPIRSKRGVLVQLILKGGMTKTGLFLSEETSLSRGVTRVEDQHLIAMMTKQSVVLIHQGDRALESLNISSIGVEIWHRTRNVVALRTEIHPPRDIGNRRHHLRHQRTIVHLVIDQQTTVETGSDMSFHSKLLLPDPLLGLEVSNGPAIAGPFQERLTSNMGLTTIEIVDTPEIVHPQTSCARITEVQTLGPSSLVRDMVMVSGEDLSFGVS